MKHIYRLVGLAIFFVLCYHLDMLLEMLFAQTDFFEPEARPIPQAWWDRLVESGKSFIFEKIGVLIETLLLLTSKMFWPFLFAAVAVPVLLPRDLRSRNRWSAALAGILTLASIWLFVLVKDDLSALWLTLREMRFGDLSGFSSLLTKIKWVMAVFAINLTILYTWLYRVLHAFKVEQLLYFFVLCANAIYILMPDPILGEVDDVLGIFVTAFLSLAIFFDRILTRTQHRHAQEVQDVPID